ncbi:hypothetical protein FGG08_000494 [Glutinoglossum americanum]|uniref:Uncharacterized protein n=1 Tax=Glutinoglossum americanum TaxID=1670608 RepID=A0A9P8IDD6_9PEZI|nr:hypothetical protein FGG08_000494 [Glutinoglossum americanum]
MEDYNRAKSAFNQQNSQSSHSSNRGPVVGVNQYGLLESQIQTLKRSLREEVEGHNNSRTRLNQELQRRLDAENSMNQLSLAYTASYGMVGQLQGVIGQKDCQITELRNKLDKESKEGDMRLDMANARDRQIRVLKAELKRLAPIEGDEKTIADGDTSHPQSQHAAKCRRTDSNITANGGKPVKTPPQV